METFWEQGTCLVITYLSPDICLANRCSVYLLNESETLNDFTLLDGHLFPPLFFHSWNLSRSICRAPHSQVVWILNLWIFVWPHVHTLTWVSIFSICYLNLQPLPASCFLSISCTNLLGIYISKPFLNCASPSSKIYFYLLIHCQNFKNCLLHFHSFLRHLHIS